MRYKNWFVISLLLMLAAPFTLNANESVVRNPSEPLISISNNGVKSTVKPNVKGYTLSSIFIGFGKKIAMINAKEYQEGDSFGPYLVKEINSDHVVIEATGKTRILELYAINKTGFIIK